jgi:hypothetical protein
MNNKTLAILAFVSIALIAAAVVTNQQPSNGQQTKVDNYLFPALSADIEAASRLEMYRSASDQPALSFSKQGDQWIVDSIGYPMNFEMIRSLLRTLSQAKLNEKMTANAAHYHRLGLRDVSDPESIARVLRISDQAGNSLGGLVMGRTVARGGSANTYVRREGEAQTWLIGGVVEMTPEPEKWLDIVISDIPASAIKQAEIANADGDYLGVSKENPEQAIFTIDGLPDAAELLYPGVANGVAEALNDFNLENVQTAESFTFTEGAIVRSEYQLFNGVVISVRSERRDTDYYAQLLVEYHGSDSAALEQASSLQARVNGWVYKILPHKYKVLSKRMADLLVAPEVGPSAPDQ